MSQPATIIETKTIEKPKTHAQLLESLVFLSRFHNKPESKESLTAGICHGEEDITLDQAIRIAERAGFSTEYAELTVAQIDNMILPAVLFKKDGACVVALRKDGEQIKIIEPKSSEGEGEKAVYLQDVEENFSGNLLLFQPMFQYDGRSEVIDLPKATSWFWGTIFSNWRIYSLALLGTVMVNLFVVASPIFVMTTYDRVVPNGAFDTLWVLAFGVVVIAFFDFVIKGMRSYFIDAVGKRADFIISGRVFSQILNIQLANKQKSSGVMANTLKEFESLRDFFTSATLTTIGDFPFVFFFIFVIWLIAGPLAYVPLLAVPITLGVAFVAQIPLARVIEQSFRDSALKSAHLFEVLHGIETVKGAGLSAWANQAWETYVGRTAKSQMKARLISSLVVNFSQSMLLLTNVGIIVYGVYEIGKGNMTLGVLIAAMILSSRAMAPLVQVANLMVRYQQSKASLNALHKIMLTPVDRPDNKHFIQRSHLRGEIQFREADFSYPDEPLEALKNINIHIQPGEHVGILGRIGAGKTTLLKMIAGLYQPDAGACLVDGIDIRQIDAQDLRRNIGYVMQDSTLFYGTIKTNITLGAPYIDDETFLKACQIAGVEDFVKQHPRGYDQPVGEHGESLSGGQKQAIAVARALLLDPPILLFDEPTANMDHSTEQAFIKHLMEDLKDKTIVIVTHRTSILPAIDRLVVMDKGRVFADGPKDKVLAKLQEK